MSRVNVDKFNSTQAEVVLVPEGTQCFPETTQPLMELVTLSHHSLIHGQLLYLQ